MAEVKGKLVLIACSKEMTLHDTCISDNLELLRLRRISPFDHGILAIKLNFIREQDLNSTLPEE